VVPNFVELEAAAGHDLLPRSTAVATPRRPRPRVFMAASAPHEDWGTPPPPSIAASASPTNSTSGRHPHRHPQRSGFVEDTIAAFQGPHIHTFIAKARRRHAPDIIPRLRRRMSSPSSTNPTRPFTVNTIDEHLECSWSAITSIENPRGRRLRREPYPPPRPSLRGPAQTRRFSMMSSDSQRWPRGESSPAPGRPPTR